MARNYAALPHDYAVEMETLNDAEFGRLCRALLEYSKTGEEVQLKGNEKFLWNRVKMQEQRFQASYEELSEIRSEAGRKGAEKPHINGILITAVCAVLVSVTGLLTIFPYGYYQWLSQLASFSVGLACGIAYTLFLLFNQAQSNTNQPHDKRRLNP